MIRPPSVLDLRSAYHETVCRTILGLRTGTTYFSNADSGQVASVNIAEALAARLDYPLCSAPPSGQASGARLALHTKTFLTATLSRLELHRPGQWRVDLTQGRDRIAAFDQYSHLAELRRIAREDPRIRPLLNVDYLVGPDITVSRLPLSNTQLDPDGDLGLATDEVATLTPLRAGADRLPLLHGSVSCKWTIRSDRAQNSRTEALNLLRNRRGRAPHIAVVTFEPLPARLASIAFGTGDVDCTYHGALTELRLAVANVANSESQDLLESLVAGHRLRDISDLPFDLIA